MSETSREEVADALFAEYDAKLRDGGTWDWWLSQEWLDELERLFDVGHNDLPKTLIGLPTEVRDDAGFPKLVRREGT